MASLMLCAALLAPAAAAQGIIATVAGGARCLPTDPCGDGGPATSASLNNPWRAAFDAAGNLFIADRGSRRIRKVDATTGIITTVAGTGVRGFNGDGIPATSAQLSSAIGLAFDAAGNLYIGDFDNARIRKVVPGSDGVINGGSDEIITTVAGTGTRGFSGDGGPATSASLNFPAGVAFDAAGNLFIADEKNNRIRKVVPGSDGVINGGTDEIITTVAGNGTRTGSIDGPGGNPADDLGDGGPATSASLNFPKGVAFDAAGNLFIADQKNDRILRVSASAPNQPPVANAGPDQTVECSSPASTAVSLDGSGSDDPDSDPLSFEWKDSGGTVVGNDAVVNLTLPLGTHSFTLTVDDGNGGTDSDTVDVTVTVGVVGFQSPLGALVPEGVAIPVPDKAFKQGRTLPLKLQLFCGGTALTDADVAPPQIVALVPTGGTPVDLEVVDLDSGAANDNGLLFRYSDPNWVYNLSTKGLSGGTTYTIVIEMPDGLRYAAAFALK